MGGSSGGGSGSGQTTTQSTTTTPWDKQQPYLEDVFKGAQTRYQSGNPQYFPGQTVQGFAPAQAQAQQMGIDRATAGNPLLPAAQGQAMQTINGDYLNAGNPYTSALVNSVNAAVRPGIDARFSNAGRYGSTAHGAATTTAMTNAIAPQLFGQYQQERGNQLAQSNAAPALAGADYTDINNLSSIGAQQQGQGQNVLNSDIERYNFGQNLEANKLAQYMGLIQGNYGGTGLSTATGPGGNSLLQGAGLGLQGASAVGSLGQGLGKSGLNVGGK